jgi:HSP20 family protein
MTTIMEVSPPWLRDVNRFFGAEATATSFFPPADVLIDEEGVQVYMDVPGVTREQLEVNLENEVLTVRGERPFPYTQDGQSHSGARRIERRFGSFERSLRVPVGMDPDSIEASLGDGVLSLRIPKPNSMQPRKIEIRADGRQPEGGTAESGGEQQRPTGTPSG